MKRDSAEPQENGIVRIEPAKRATAHNRTSFLKPMAVARFAGLNNKTGLTWGSALSRFTPGFIPPPAPQAKNVNIHFAQKIE